MYGWLFVLPLCYKHKCNRDKITAFRAILGRKSLFWVKGPRSDGILSSIKLSKELKPTTSEVSQGNALACEHQRFLSARILYLRMPVHHRSLGKRCTSLPSVVSTSAPQFSGASELSTPGFVPKIPLLESS